MYSHVVLGGTFDHLHLGHKDLLSLAFSEGKKVTIGLTKASMNTQKTLSKEIEAYAIREKAIKEYAKSISRENDVHIIPITDIYGSTLSEQTLEAIVVTPHTHPGALHINTEREKRGLSPLQITICELRNDENGEILCSSNIRLGKVNRDGKSYQNLFSTDLILSESAREILHRPFGQAIGAKKLKTVHNRKIVVGDVVTQYCIDNAIPFTCAYIDGHSKRKPFMLRLRKPYMKDESSVKNPAGSITSETAKLILDHAEATERIIQIDGEEDLLTVASVLLLPFGTQVLYGYPYRPRSMRMITVNERMKEKFAEILAS